VIAAGFLVIIAIAIVSFISPTIFWREQTAATRHPLPAESVTVRVDKLFAQWDRSDSPGCSLGVSRNGVLVYERGYGTANLELGIAITPASVFDVASIAKPFTAMSILLLAQRGQLSLDDEVRKHMSSSFRATRGQSPRDSLSARAARGACASIG
jgi:CubicO group peptidase (beta-lactamase class C family)